VHNCRVRRIHGLAVTSLLAGLLGLVLVVLVLPASAVPIPASYLTLYRQAARTCPGLTWEVLAGIGTVESSNGQSRARGVHRGKNRKGAEGPMQFEPATFAEYAVRADRTAKLTPYNPADAVFTAARMLCADGAANGPQGLRHAIYAYNHACWYVREVLTLAARYAGVRKPRPIRTGFCAVHHHKRGHGKRGHGGTSRHGKHGPGKHKNGKRGHGHGHGRRGHGRPHAAKRGHAAKRHAPGRVAKRGRPSG
jgi:Transglycosylase SLT domain